MYSHFFFTEDLFTHETSHKIALINIRFNFSKKVVGLYKKNFVWNSFLIQVKALTNMNTIHKSLMITFLHMNAITYNILYQFKISYKVYSESQAFA